MNDSSSAITALPGRLLQGHSGVQGTVEPRSQACRKQLKDERELETKKMKKTIIDAFIRYYNNIIENVILSILTDNPDNPQYLKIAELIRKKNEIVREGIEGAEYRDVRYIEDVENSSLLKNKQEEIVLYASGLFNLFQIAKKSQNENSDPNNSPNDPSRAGKYNDILNGYKPSRAGKYNDILNGYKPSIGGKKQSGKRKPSKKRLRKIHKGPRGGKYYILKGRKVYI